MRVCLKELRETLVWLEFSEQMGIGEIAAVKKGIMESDELIRIFVKSIQTAQQNDRAMS